jgi:hypothetical protein
MPPLLFRSRSVGRPSRLTRRCFPWRYGSAFRSRVSLLLISKAAVPKTPPRLSRILAAANRWAISRSNILGNTSSSRRLAATDGRKVAIPLNRLLHLRSLTIKGLHGRCPIRPEEALRLRTPESPWGSRAIRRVQALPRRHHRKAPGHQLPFTECSRINPPGRNPSATEVLRRNGRNCPSNVRIRSHQA